MDPEHAEAHLRKAIAVERRHRRGGAQELDRKLGRSRGYLRRLLQGDVSFQVSTLFEIVDRLRYEPGEFFLWVFGPTHLRADPFLEKLGRRADRPEILRRVDPLLRLEESAGNNDHRTLADEERSARFWSDIQRLNVLSHSNPRMAKEETAALLLSLAEEIERHGEPLDLLTRYVALAGVIAYFLADHPAAACYFASALDHARRRSNQRLESEIYRWCGRLAATQGDHHAALAFSDRARELAVLLHDLPGIGSSLIHRALVMRRLGDSGGAVSHLRSALEYLPSEQWPSRSLVFENLAVIHLDDLGDLAKARQFCRLSESEHRTKEGLQWWSKAWIRAEIALAENRLDDAEAELLKLREVERAQHRSLEIARACVGLARVYVRSGDLVRCMHVIRETGELMEGTRAVNKKVGFLLEKLISVSRSGKLTVDVVDRLAGEMDDAIAGKGSKLFDGD